MGNLVRKPAVLYFNTIDAATITYSAGNELVFKDYNAIAPSDEILKFKKTSYAAGTVQVDTITPVIPYPASANDGAEFIINIKGKSEMTAGLGAGRADQFYLVKMAFQATLESLAAENAGYLADADYTLLMNQVRNAINTHQFYKDLIVASGTTTLILTSKLTGYQFEVTLSTKYGTIVLTTPGVYDILPADEIYRIFAIKKYDAGRSLDNYPTAAVTDWSTYYFKVKRGGYALDGSNHLDSVIEEVRFYLPTAVAEASTGLNWDEKIYDFITENGYSDPDGDTTPWGLLFTI